MVKFICFDIGFKIPKGYFGKIHLGPALQFALLILVVQS